MPYMIVSGCVLLALFIVRISIGKLRRIDSMEISFAQTTGKREICADAMDWARYQNEYLFVLADGIGSGTKGRTSALTAVDSISRMFDINGVTSNPAYFFRHAFSVANDAVLRYVPDGTAGANLLCAVIKDGLLYYALAGNCRVSVFRDGELISLSEGQTLDVLAKRAFRREQITREDAQLAFQERRVYNYVGKDDFKELEMFDVPVVLEEGDVVVMMTDGIYDFCTERSIEDVLKSGMDCDDCADAVIDILDTQDDKSQDNASILLVRINHL